MKKIISKTIMKWADRIGIVSLHSQEQLRDMLISALPDNSAQIAEQTATIARLTAANENERKLNDTAFLDNLAALKKQAEEIRELKQALTDIRATTVMLGDSQGGWKAWRECCEIAGKALK